MEMTLNTELKLIDCKTTPETTLITATKSINSPPKGCFIQLEVTADLYIDGFLF